MTSGNQISLFSLAKRYKGRITITGSLVFVEAILGILYPLFIGIAIDDLLHDSFNGIYQLLMLGAASLIVGSARRFYDTRVYSGIYREIAVEVVEAEYQKNKSVSSTAARADLLTEFVDFFEDAIPELIGAAVALIGILVILYTLDFDIFLGCLALFGLVAIVYSVSARLNFRFNQGYNDQFELQVENISRRDRTGLVTHFQRLMTWNIRLSDLETVNYAIVWLGAIGLFLATPIILVHQKGITEYGMIFAVLLYVFDFIDALVALPLHIQQAIRLHEISKRLKA